MVDQTKLYCAFETPPSFDQRPDSIRHEVGRRAGREKAEIVTLAVHDVDESRMIDRVHAADANSFVALL
jgi:hypothetical protein